MLSAELSVQLETNLADFAAILGKDESAYRQAAAARKAAINTLMWDQQTGK